MRPRELSYRCDVCGWQGVLEPTEAGDSAECPRCGLLLTPQSWAQTWGVALAIIGFAVVSIFLASMAMS